METKIVISLPEHNQGKWKINLTDGARVWDKQCVEDPAEALTYVKQWRAAGCALAFESAYIDLLEAYTSQFRELLRDAIRMTYAETVKLVQHQQPVAVA
jgi:hypothetical protein